MPPEELEQLLRYLKALADQTRLRMLGLLATQERSVEELAALLGLRAPTVSHHLGKLKELELVEMRAEGNTHLYRLNGHGLGAMNRLLATPENISVLAKDEKGDAWERKVLGDFFENGRLKTIPAQERKKLVILKWLSNQFERGRVYSEKEVNALLAAYHPDTASLRRYLVGFRFLAREHGAYWRMKPDSISDALLASLAERFERGREYSEVEVNDTLARYAPDHSTDMLRRDLLGTNRLWIRSGRYVRSEPTA
ncbi:MAG: metalloregulator ArsR/SmtB family transcription factor [Ktedonobacterales bacterium]